MEAWHRGSNHRGRNKEVHWSTENHIIKNRALGQSCHRRMSSRALVGTMAASGFLGRKASRIQAHHGRTFGYLGGARKLQYRNAVNTGSRRQSSIQQHGRSIALRDRINDDHVVHLV